MSRGRQRAPIAHGFTAHPHGPLWEFFSGHLCPSPEGHTPGVPMGIRPGAQWADSRFLKISFSCHHQPKSRNGVLRQAHGPRASRAHWSKGPASPKRPCPNGSPGNMGPRALWCEWASGPEGPVGPKGLPGITLRKRPVTGTELAAAPNDQNLSSIGFLGDFGEAQ